MSTTLKFTPLAENNVPSETSGIMSTTLKFTPLAENNVPSETSGIEGFFASFISIFGTSLIIQFSIFFIFLLIITIILYNFFPRKKKQI